MICFRVRISPFGREEVELHFAALPSPKDVLDGLSDLIRGEGYPGGPSVVGRCIDVIAQRGLPRLEERRRWLAVGRIKWPIPGPPDRIGHIVMEEFDLLDPAAPLRSEALAKSEPAPVAVEQPGETELPPANGGGIGFDELRARCHTIIRNITSPGEQAHRVAGGLLARLLFELYSAGPHCP